MKKIILGFMLVFLATTFANAAKVTPMKAVANNVTDIKYQINLGDITNKSDQEIKEQIVKALKTIEDDDLECEVTLKGTVKAFFLSIDISITVKGSCSEMIRDGINTSGLILAAVKAKLLSL